MPLQRSPRPWSVLASPLAAAAVMVAVASCSGITPLGPASPPKPKPAKQVTAAGPPQRVFLLGTPFVLEAMGIQAPTPAGGCPPGSVALSGGPGQCYRDLATPVTISTAQISSVVTGGPPPGPPGIPAGQSGFVITLPGSDGPALKAITTTAADAQGYFSISVAGQTWLLGRVLGPFTGALSITFASTNQVLQLQRLLVQSD
jgi:hypothetical protein